MFKPMKVTSSLLQRSLTTKTLENVLTKVITDKIPVESRNAFNSDASVVKFHFEEIERADLSELVRHIGSLPVNFI